jgi:ABC-2 type transport system ATP-binding protein
VTAVIEVENLTRRFGRFTAVDEVSFSIEENGIYGLLGRNGAGKTTIMHLLTGQDFATSGSIRVFGARPAENASVLENVCFIKESQRYPDDYKPKHVLAAAPAFFANWDADFATELVQKFRLPVNRRIKKLSRGQTSALGVIVGLASRAPLTFFDEPYLGLDAVARQLFYDTLLADYAEHPRTVVLSTHLIDEVADLLEHVIVIDDGHIIINDSADNLRGTATTVAGKRADVDAFIAGREVLHTEGIGGLATATVRRLTDTEKKAAAAAGLELSGVSLQQLIVRMTQASTSDVEATREFEQSA